MDHPSVISPADSRGSPEREQQAAGVGILLQIMMLVLSFVLGHVLRRHKFYYLPEASASLLIGLVVGGLANISNTETSIREWFNFHEEFFFLFLLPPIIFQSGFILSPVSYISQFMFASSKCHESLYLCLNLLIEVYFSETFLLQFWSHCDICYSWNLHSFCLDWASCIFWWNHISHL